MKNGLFNLIRGIAFCFVLSIIFIFGRVEVKADTIPYSQITGEFIYQLCCEKVGADMTDITFNSNKIRNGMNKKTYYAPPMVTDDSYPYAILSDKFSDTLYQFYVVSMPKNPVSDEDVETFCNKHLYHQISQNVVYDSSNKKVYALGYADNGSIQAYSFTANKIAVANKDSSGVFRVSGTDSNSWRSVTFYSYQTDILYYSNQSSSLKYDSSLGYLTNVKVKRASPFLLTDMSTDFTNIIDRFSWGAVTSGGSSFDGVDVRIKTFKNEDILGEVEKHINCPPDNYNFDWGNHIDLTLKDWVFGNLFRYEIYFRPTFGNKYGDYCYFNVCFPTSVNEQIEATLDPKYLTDSIQYVENVGYIENFDEYSPPADGTTLFVPNYVVPNKPIDDINKDLDDDNVVPPSSPSYTEITNNITIIQNGNQSGDSFLDMIGDLFTFFKEFLQFLYNFINLLLTPLAFLPSWLKSLISMSIVMCLAICIIKIIRG